MKNYKNYRVPRRHARRQFVFRQGCISKCVSTIKPCGPRPFTYTSVQMGLSMDNYKVLQYPWSNPGIIGCMGGARNRWGIESRSRQRRYIPTNTRSDFLRNFCRRSATDLRRTSYGLQGATNFVLHGPQTEFPPNTRNRNGNPSDLKRSFTTNLYCNQSIG